MNRQQLIELLQSAEAYHAVDSHYECEAGDGKPCTCNATNTNEAIQAAIQYLENQFDVLRITLKPTDVIVLKPVQRLPMENIRRITESAQEAFGEDRKIVVLDPTLELTVIDKEAA